MISIWNSCLKAMAVERVSPTSDYSTLWTGTYIQCLHTSHPTTSDRLGLHTSSQQSDLPRTMNGSLGEATHANTKEWQLFSCVSACNRAKKSTPSTRVNREDGSAIHCDPFSSKGSSPFLETSQFQNFWILLLFCCSSINDLKLKHESDNGSFLLEPGWTRIYQYPDARFSIEKNWDWPTWSSKLSIQERGNI